MTVEARRAQVRQLQFSRTFAMVHKPILNKRRPVGAHFCASVDSFSWKHASTSAKRKRGKGKGQSPWILCKISLQPCMDNKTSCSVWYLLPWQTGSCTWTHCETISSFNDTVSVVLHMYVHFQDRKPEKRPKRPKYFAATFLGWGDRWHPWGWQVGRGWHFPTGSNHLDWQWGRGDDKQTTSRLFKQGRVLTFVQTFFSWLFSNFVHFPDHFRHYFQHIMTIPDKNIVHFCEADLPNLWREKGSLFCWKKKLPASCMQLEKGLLAKKFKVFFLFCVKKKPGTACFLFSPDFPDNCPYLSWFLQTQKMFSLTLPEFG